MELFHSIADGTGAMVFLKTLAARYLQLAGYPVKAGEKGALDCSEPPPGRRMGGQPQPVRPFPPYRGAQGIQSVSPRHDRMPVPFLRVITGTLPVEAVKAKARERGVSVNDYLAGVICYAFLRLQQMEGTAGSIRLSSACRSTCGRSIPPARCGILPPLVNPGVDPRYGDYDLEEIIQHIHHFMRLRLNEKIPQRRAFRQRGQ